MNYQSKQILSESWNTFSKTEKLQILEAEILVSKFLNEISSTNEYQLLNEGIFDRGIAKAKGAASAVGQVGKNLRGSDDDISDPREAARRKKAEVLFDRFKNDIVKLTSQMGKDFGGFENKNLQQIPVRLQNTVKKLSLKDTSFNLKDAGKSAVGAGKKAVDAGRKAAAEKIMPVVQSAVGKFGSKIESLYQKSGPIKNFDEKYKKLIGDLSKKYPGLSERIGEFSKLAMAHKGKATFIVGAMVALLTAAGATGPAAPLVAGIGMRGIYGLLAGEPPAKAFGKAAITALVGKLIGGGIKEFFGSIFDGISVDGADVDAPDADIPDAPSGPDGAPEVPATDSTEAGEANPASESPSKSDMTDKEARRAAWLEKEDISTLGEVEAQTGISGEDAYDMGLKRSGGENNMEYLNYASSDTENSLRHLALKNPEVAKKLGYEVTPTGDGKFNMRGPFQGDAPGEISRLSKYYTEESIIDAIKNDPSVIDKMLTAVSNK